ncbi:MAG: energy transducer TonB [Lentimicrobium sp.]|jgi:antitoxin component YwqK of YwqJK toxin-antitoxin module|nr:energy transducer TonB [Lentimicrobium sp.]
MKLNLFLLLFFSISFLSFSQTSSDKIIYLDSLQNESTFENFKYLRVIKDYTQDKKNYVVIDYYDSGKVLMEGKTENKDYLVNTGQFIYYYETGNRQKIINFKKNKPIGSYFELYENGNKKLEAEYIEEKRDNPNFLKIKNYWDKDNNQKVIDGTGFYEEKEKDFYTIGKLKNGLKDSIWKGWFNNPKIYFQEEYKAGKFISGISIDENKTSKPYLEIEKKPVPAQGMSHFYHYISDKLHAGKSKRSIGFKTVEVTAEELEKIKKNYSRNLQISDHSGFEGKTYVNFVVEKDGEITNAKIIKSIDQTLDIVIINLLLNYGNWIPGEIRGRKVRCTFSLPIAIQPME